MNEKKISPITAAAAVLCAIAAIAVIAAVAVLVRGRAREELPAPPETSSNTTTPAETTTAPTETSAEPTTTPSPETTTEVTTVTTALSTTVSEVTTTTSATTVTTTAATTTAATTTEITTTAATTVKAVSIGELGYDLGESVSTDKSLARGDISKLIINEVCAKSKASLKDADGDFPDWVEIFNPTSETVNLAGAGLSDSASEPLKWVFPSVNIQPKGYLVVFCSDKDKQSPELHTNFKISSGSEQIILSKPDGSVIDSVIVGNTDDDETYGRYPNGSETFRLLEATAGKSNDNSSTNLAAGLAAPILSQKSGFYDKAFSLSIAADNGTVIYYTTDGSVPTTSSKKYSSAISIKDRSSEKAVLTYKRGTTADSGAEQFPGQEFEKATIIRAIAVDSKGRVSPVSTGTYFVGSDIAKKYKNVSVISVTIDPNDLFNNDTGIYVAGKVFSEWRKKNPTAALDGTAQGNYNQRGRDWERDAHVDFFRQGELEFSENCGVRTHGGWSRNSQQKSLKFYFRSDYGESKLKYELFENNRAYDDGKLIKEYKRFIIRNGGNDSFIMLYKDAWTQACVKDFPFSTQDTDLVICFLDGEYWGIYTLTELYDDNYLEANYGVDADNVIMIKAGGLEEGLDSDYDYWSKAVDFVSKNDMSNADNYKKACEYFDMNSLAEYIAMNVYIGNEDWIWGNWACWRARTTSDKPYEDGKWRFMVYDTEFAMNLYGSGKDYRYDILSQEASGDGHLGPLLKSLLKNSEFKSMFVLALEDSMNIAFNPSSAATLLQQYHNEYSPYLGQHFRRFIFWQNEWGVAENVNNWKIWLKNRYNYFPEQMNKVLSLGTTKTNTVTINTSVGGSIKVNGIPIKFTNSKWEGHYFSGYKIKIEAVPNSGYEFAGWSGGYDGTSPKITVDPSKALSLTANFTKK